MTRGHGWSRPKGVTKNKTQLLRKHAREVALLDDVLGELNHDEMKRLYDDPLRAAVALLAGTPTHVCEDEEVDALCDARVSQPEVEHTRACDEAVRALEPESLSTEAMRRAHIRRHFALALIIVSLRERHRGILMGARDPRSSQAANTEDETLSLEWTVTQSESPAFKLLVANTEDVFEQSHERTKLMPGMAACVGIVRASLRLHSDIHVQLIVHGLNARLNDPTRRVLHKWATRRGMSPEEARLVAEQLRRLTQTHNEVTEQQLADIFGAGATKPVRRPAASAIIVAHTPDVLLRKRRLADDEAAIIADVRELVGKWSSYPRIEIAKQLRTLGKEVLALEPAMRVAGEEETQNVLDEAAKEMAGMKRKLECVERERDEYKEAFNSEFKRSMKDLDRYEQANAVDKLALKTDMGSMEEQLETLRGMLRGWGAQAELAVGCEQG